MNWGTKIVMGMIVFMLFIVAMVVYMFAVHDNDPLVDEDYYEKGINYNMDYNAMQNVAKEHKQPKISVGRFQLIIQLKDSAAYELKMMRPSSKIEDVFKKGVSKGASNLIVIDTRDMYKGRWSMEITWKKLDKVYLYKKDLTL